MEARKVHDPAARAALAREVIEALPGWFGLPEANEAYVEEVRSLETWGVDEAGFLSLRRHTPHAAEIHVMGVRPERHRQGIGRALVGAALEALAAERVDFLQVKTLAPSHPSEGYAGTRRFYEALGFLPFEVRPELWGTGNPCLVLVRRVDLPLP